MFDHSTRTICTYPHLASLFFVHRNEIGLFRIESAANGTTYECDQRVMDAELECSHLLITTKSSLGDHQSHAQKIAMTQSLKKGWSMLSGILTVSEEVMVHDSIRLYLYGTHKTMNTFYKNISITPIPTQCHNQVLNGDFEVGDTRFWRYSSHYVDMNVLDVGVDGSLYSVMIQATNNGAFYGISQDLDMRCLEAGREFLISAKFQLLNSTDMVSGVACDPAQLTVSRPTHCPTVTVRGSDCEEGDFEFLLWNDIDHFEWDANKFNDFEQVFSVNNQLASCSVSVPLL